MQNFKKIIYLLGTAEHKKATRLFLLTLMMALLDGIGVVSILPFIMILLNPQILETNLILKNIYTSMEVFGLKNNLQFTFIIGVCTFFVLIVSLAFKAFTLYKQYSFTSDCEYSLSKRLLEGYLHQPYSWFLNRHSSGLGKTLLWDVRAVINSCISPMVTIISQSIVAIALVSVIVIVHYKLAIITIVSFIFAYILIYKFNKNLSSQIGIESAKANQSRFLILSEAFGAVKEIKIGNLEENFIKLFNRQSASYARNEALRNMIALMPRYGLESIALGGIILVILIFLAIGRNLSSFLGIIAVYSFACYRILPCLQQVYANIVILNFEVPVLDNIYKDLKNLKQKEIYPDSNFISLKRSINLNNICYSYPEDSRKIIKNISLTIPAQTTVGIVGSTGSGKTTLVDIILGLINAQEGKLEVDGIEINKSNVTNWQRLIGYVPQNIFIADNTIAANIAFGIEEKYIDQKIIERVAKIANISKFIEEELPQKYLTSVGERGVRLSGGQIQRIGIARALYNNPKVLIMDEATSALDSFTEKEVMKEIYNLSQTITIIIIAHRLSTIEKCKIIFLIENGKLVGQGNYEELNTINKQFRKIV
jgi:ABC-type multidrug transport system fused ATPase/permease subunit